MSFLINWENFDRRICKKGGGGGAGIVDYPDYMKDVHNDLLDNTGVDTVSSSLIDIINVALGSSPFATAIAYDPDTDIAAWETAITSHDALLAAITETTDWATLYTQADTTIQSAIDADVAAFADEQDDQLTTVVLPRFNSGMRDINAVVSSAFVVGQALIEGFRDRDVARHSSKLRVSKMQMSLEGTDQMLRLLLSKYAWEESYVRMVVESRRIKIVAKSEEAEANLEIDEADATWDLELFQHGANLLAGIGGGTMVSQKNKRSRGASAIGGAMSGAAAGTMIAPGIGTAIGAVLGAAAGYASA